MKNVIKDCITTYRIHKYPGGNIELNPVKQTDGIFLTLDLTSLQKDNCLTMRNISTITSKRQLTIPAEIFEKANLKIGDKLSFTIQPDGSILIKSPLATIEKLSKIVRVSDQQNNQAPHDSSKLSTVRIYFDDKNEK